MKALPKQGQLLRGGSEIGGEIWALAVSAMSSEKMKFALNAATDIHCHTIATVLDDCCRLCGQ